MRFLLYSHSPGQRSSDFNYKCMHVFKVFNLKLQDVSANFNESQIYILLKPSLERALNYFKDVSQLSN